MNFKDFHSNASTNSHRLESKY